MPDAVQWANEICFELTGEKKGAYEGLDGVFTAIWTALESYPEWTILLLDEVDHVAHDSNYDPSEFFYRLFRGEGKLKRDIQLSAWLISNELLEVDLRLDSRVQSAMSGEEVFFPPYGREELEAILDAPLEQAFRDDALSEAVVDYGVTQAARRWGDARKALRLFRYASETANERGYETVTTACLEENLESAEKDALIEKLLELPFNHYHVLLGITGWNEGGTNEIKQPVTTTEISGSVNRAEYDSAFHLGERAIRDIVTDLETMGLVETWLDSRGRDGRIKRIKTTFDPQWVRDSRASYAAQSDDIDELLTE